MIGNGMGRVLLLCMMVLLLVSVGVGAPGCGNVSLRGEALTAAERSAMDAHQAAVRAERDLDSSSWVRAYLAENYRQWRFFVRAARLEDAWGPALPGEASTPEPAGGGG